MHLQGNANIDDVTICMNNLLDVKESVVQDFNDAATYEKANGLSAQTGGLPLRVRCTSMMFEDRTGYQIFTVKLKACDIVTDPAKYGALPDVIMRQIPTGDGGPPLYIRFVLSVTNTISHSLTHTRAHTTTHNHIQPHTTTHTHARTHVLSHD